MVIGHDLIEGVFSMRRALIRIGRDQDNHLILPHDSVSRYHARVYWSENGFIIEDLGSANGTHVSQIQLWEGASKKLRPHAALWFGAIPCLFLMNDSKIHLPRRTRLARARRTLARLVATGCISRYQARDALKLARGNVDTVAENFIKIGVVTPDEWSEAYAVANASALLS